MTNKKLKGTSECELEINDKTVSLTFRASSVGLAMKIFVLLEDILVRLQKDQNSLLSSKLDSRNQSQNKVITIDELIEALSEYNTGDAVQCLTATGGAFKINAVTRCEITNNILINIEPITGYFLDEETNNQ